MAGCASGSPWSPGWPAVSAPPWRAALGPVDVLVCNDYTVDIAPAHAMPGLTGLGRQLATEYGGRLRVNSVLRGPLLNAAWDDLGEDDRRERCPDGHRPARQNGEVAAAVAFLAGDDASFVTGASLTVDGGWSTVEDLA